jgi:hypothetical protein
MASGGGRGLGFLFGVLGGVLIVVEGLIDLIRGAFFLAVGHPYLGLGALGASVLFVVLGLVFIMFAVLGSSRAPDRALASGVVMVVVALLGLLLLGFANGIIGLLGTVFVLIGGLLYLVAGR